MAGYSGSRSFVQRFILLTFVAVLLVTGEEICDLSKCRGPLRYYKDLGCKPVYKQSGDCCPKSYNCDHLKNLSRDKCYANGHEYSVGEKMRDEDKTPCENECICMWDEESVILSRLYPKWRKASARFVCTGFGCDLMFDPNCYYKNSHDRCCPGPYVCLKEGEERPTCEVDGKIYKDGEYFQPESDPELDCYCQPGYKGKNVEPFCKKPKRNYYSPLFRRPSDIHQKCAPVFDDNQNPQKDGSLVSRCQYVYDTVIRNNDNGKSLSNEEENNVCFFGDMRMHVGDELNPELDIDSVCVKCVCEVPPILTCQKVPSSVCNASAEFETITLYPYL